MALTISGIAIDTHENDITQNMNTYDDFISKVKSTYGNENTYHIFLTGKVKIFELNNESVYLWLDIKGNVCYTFKLLDKEYTATTATKLSNVLSSHFQYVIEIVNNINELFRKKTVATIGLTKALSEKQRYNDYAAYSQNNFSEQIFGGINIIESTNQQVSLYQPEIQQQPILNQEQLYKEIVDLSTNQLQYNKQISYIQINELPTVQKELFRPSTKLAFFVNNGLLYKNAYITTEYMIQPLLKDNNNSFILPFILSMVKNSPIQAMDVFIWLANSFNTLQKLPFVLVLHSENDTCMKLFYEEIIMPLFNHDYCTKIDDDNLDKKSLSNKLDEKVINHFHNILTPTILDAPAQELTKRLIHKDDYKLNTKVITTVANTLITSTSKYIPLIAKDVLSLVIEVESNLDNFCGEKNISVNYYQIVNLIENDLTNFANLLRNIDLTRLNHMSSLNYYDSNKNIDIMDGDADILKVFEVSIKNKDIVFFKRLEIIAEKLYKKLILDFNKNRVDRKNLIKYFSILFGEDIYKSNRALIAGLRGFSTTKEAFENEKTFNNNGTVYYNLY